VVLLGGGTNALSIARSLGRSGVPVYAVNFPHEAVRYSRHARWIPLPDASDAAAVWTEYLLGPESDHLRGAILLAASDAGLQIIAEHRPALAARFHLDDSNPRAQLRMLDKLSTYQAAAAAGVATPRFWTAASLEEIEAARAELVYPLIVKPRLSHLFEHRFGAKFVVVDNFEELRSAYRSIQEANISVLLVEKIPGPDDQLCSYYTYLDEDSNPLFHFTKRIIRRYPPNMGAACYHITDAIPELHELGAKLFRHVGLRGLANVEFKHDRRDGRLKLIECNARFTAANCLVERAGFDLAGFVYRRVVGMPQTPLSGFRNGVRLWYPLEDFRAFRALRRQGELSFHQWAASVLHWQTLPYFRWSDPLPTLVDQFRRVKRKLWPGAR
jgi:predicted ATP-grasp superfamily ATP-dependent carboligase